MAKYSCEKQKLQFHQLRINVPDAVAKRLLFIPISVAHKNRKVI